MFAFRSIRESVQLDTLPSFSYFTPLRWTAALSAVVFLVRRTRFIVFVGALL